MPNACPAVQWQRSVAIPPIWPQIGPLLQWMLQKEGEDHPPWPSQAPIRRTWSPCSRAREGNPSLFATRKYSVTCAS
ncbi:hypothetical protein N7486_002752 [Penicillium sp. IBT 16267x]|nr:hypothetical protein N7486_002752 [Penicillium sp. IBT 16267x]